jgi:hypothetical protein
MYRQNLETCRSIFRNLLFCVLERSKRYRDENRQYSILILFQQAMGREKSLERLHFFLGKERELVNPGESILCLVRTSNEVEERVLYLIVFFTFMDYLQSYSLRRGHHR